jgi:hypothetical protein
MAAGSTVQVWINQAGRLASRPLQHDEVVSRVLLALLVTEVPAGW